MGAPQSIPRRLISIDDYHRMSEVGVLKEDDRIELIDGEMIKMAPIGSRHLAKVNRLARLLSQSAGNQVIVSVQNPIALPPNNEPQPDIALLKPRTDDYESALPGPSDILLVVEIADTTLSYDRDAKVPIYANHNIVETWLIDIQSKSLTICLDPSDKGYQRFLTPQIDEVISPLLLPNVRVALRNFWK